MQTGVSGILKYLALPCYKTGF